MKVVILADVFDSDGNHVIDSMEAVNGVPFLEIVMRSVLYSDPECFVLCVRPNCERIVSYFGANFLGVPVFYSFSEPAYGTGGALKNAFDTFNIESAIVLYGDCYVQNALDTLLELDDFEELSLVLKQVKTLDQSDRFLIENDRVVNVCGKEDLLESGLVTAGMYRIKNQIFKDVDSACFSFEKDIIGQKIPILKPRFVMAGDYSIYINKLKSDQTAKEKLLNDVFGKKTRKALFLDRDGVINKEISYLHKVEDCIFVEGIFELCKKAKVLGYELVIVTNQAGIAKGYFTYEEYEKLMQYIEQVFADSGCKFSAVYFCPYHKDGIGKYKKVSFYRKPNPGMILKAARDLDLNLVDSILIGDQPSDIEAGKAAGVGKCILFKGNKHTLDFF